MGTGRYIAISSIRKYRELFFSAVYDRFMPSNPANLRDPYKIRFSIFFEKSKNLVNPMVWRCREFFLFQDVQFFFRPDIFTFFFVRGHFIDH